MKKNKLFIGLLFCLFTFEVHAKQTQFSTRYEKGFFSIGTLVGHSETSLLNQDGTSSSFTGFGYGVDLDISIKPLIGADIRIFGMLFNDELKQSSRFFKLQSKSTMLGVRFFANEYIYLSLGSGTMEQTLKSEISDIKLKNNSVMGGAGFIYPITESLTIGLGFNKTVNPVKSTDGTVGNSFSENQFYFLNFNWSPPSTTINTSVRGL